MNFFKPNIHSEHNQVQRRDQDVRNDEARYQNALAEKANQEQNIRYSMAQNTREALQY